MGGLNLAAQTRHGSLGNQPGSAKVPDLFAIGPLASTWPGLVAGQVVYGAP